jgi:hypothetical protein
MRAIARGGDQHGKLNCNRIGKAFLNCRSIRFDQSR